MSPYGLCVKRNKAKSVVFLGASVRNYGTLFYGNLFHHGGTEGTEGIRRSHHAIPYILKSLKEFFVFNASQGKINEDSADQ